MSAPKELRHITWRGDDEALCGATGAIAFFRSEECEACRVIQSFIIARASMSDLTALRVEVRTYLSHVDGRRSKR